MTKDHPSKARIHSSAALQKLAAEQGLMRWASVPIWRSEAAFLGCFKASPTVVVFQRLKLGVLSRAEGGLTHRRPQGTLFVEKTYRTQPFWAGSTCW